MEDRGQTREKKKEGKWYQSTGFTPCHTYKTSGGVEST